MGEGVTNPARGEASPSSLHSTAEVVITSLLSAERFEDCLHLVVLVSLACVFAAHWMINKRKDWSRINTAESTQPEPTLAAEHSSRSCSVESSGGVVATGLTRKSEPHLRRSEIVCKTGRTVSSLDKCSNSTSVDSAALPIPTSDLSESDICALSDFFKSMDTASGDVPPQPDSFFTWDSGGSSGEYSFVHTAVELPKYPDGAISEEEKQMLLLYMQTGHPELLLNSSQVANMNSVQNQSDSLLCDPAAAARGFLETIVEETSDDLRSPSECDEASVGWGSWDESDDEDRLTVVEMVTSANHRSEVSPGPVYTSADMSNQRGGCSDQLSSVSSNPDQLVSLGAAEDLFPNCDIFNDRRNNDSDMDILSFNASNTHGVSDMDNITQQQCSEVFHEGVPGNSNPTLQLGVSPDLDSLVESNVNSSFDTLWITANDLESPSETLNPWIVNRFLDPKEHSLPDQNNLEFTVNRQSEKCENSLLFIGSDDICLVPSSQTITETEPETLMFSDNFKDYFLPSENYVPGFSKDDLIDPNEMPSELLPTDTSQKKGLRCFRIGFDASPTEQFSVSHLDQSMISEDTDQKQQQQPCLDYSDSDSEASKTKCELLQETMFSPVEGDIVYGSSWLSSRPLKEPEKISSGAEVHCSTAQTEVRQSPTMLSESPSPDNNRGSPELCASDDDTPVVPNSLSRWGHHTNLQHLQEDSSPIARWQHEADLLQSSSAKSKQTYSSEESDDGLPPQLKEIYSSFKMKDNKMGRIRIKEDKNNNFKRLGLWDNESKVTLPPFNLASGDAEKIVPKQKEQSSSREDLDDLDIDMFTVTKSGNGSKPADKGDSDIDDALKSFDHLDDYTSDENSENENNYPINVREKSETIPSEPIKTDKDFKNIDCEINHSEKNHSSLENPCSDTSDNCPLCTDPRFKNPHINDLFSLKTSESAENDVQSLLQKTYPKMVRLSQSNLSDPEIHELTTEPNKTADSSVSPLTSSDSDEGNRKVKEIKKRIKKRPKESANTELKHDDSGYVEDDEDDDEDDSLGEKKDKRSSMSICSSNPDLTRKSLSTAFYESKLLKSEGINEESSSSYAIPETFQEFSKQLEQSMSTDEMKAGFLEAEKWNIPENLSQFSAWLLDKELKKINNREEMEKLFVDDIMSLREQTIAKFLQNSHPADEGINLKSLASLSLKSNVESVEKEMKITCDDIVNLNQSKSITNTDLNNQNMEIIKSNSTSKTECSDLPEWDFDIETPINSEPSINTNDNQDKILGGNLPVETKISETHIDSNASDDSSSSKNRTDSDNELSEEYYNFNFNKKVSNVFGECSFSQMINNSITAPEQVVSTVIEEIEEEIEPSSTTADEPLETEAANTELPPESVAQQINTSDTEATQLDTTCYKNYEPDSSDPQNNNSADAKTDNTEVKPVTDNDEVLFSLQPEASIIYHPSASEDTTKIIQPKVNDTTIQQEEPLTDENEEKALPELIPSKVMPSIGSIPNQNITVNLDCGNDVAPSTEEDSNDFDGSGRDLAGADFDLMTQGVEKGAFEGCAGKEADYISSLEALVVSRESDRETHVLPDACHAHHQDGTASSLISDNSDTSHVFGVLDSCINSALNSDGTAGDSVLTGDSDNVNIVSEEGAECCVLGGVASVPEERSQQVSAGEFTTFNCFAAPDKDCVTAAKEATNDVGDCSFEVVHSEVVKVSKQCSSDNSQISICDVRNSENAIDDVTENNDLLENNYTAALDDELIISEDYCRLNSVNSKSCVDLRDNHIDSNKPDVVSCCEKSIPYESSTPEIPIYRPEYKRSNSLGRKPEEEQQFEPISTQSKSTPDLRRCHEQQLRSTQPLSALLSKSVSQRIQDYLGSSLRGDRLLRSLPPNERSRHYRRICVSTETVVEKAARFENRSQSSRPPPRDESPFKIRSGSCPPSRMKNNNTSWISERNHYSKPTATVRPTIDSYRNGIHKLSNGDPYHRNIFLDQIAGYSKTKPKNGELSNGQHVDPSKKKEDFMELITGYSKATKVTHKPPMAPTSGNHSSMKTARLKGKLASARKQFFERISSNQDLTTSHDSVRANDQSDDEDNSGLGLGRFSEFRRSARAERARLAASHPDLGALEAAVRSSKRRIDQMKKKNKNCGEEPPHSQNSPMPSTREEQPLLPYRRCTGEIAWASCAQRVREASERRKQLQQQRQQLEIVDRRECREGLRAHGGAEEPFEAEEEEGEESSAIAGGALEFLGSRARSMDFLLDAENRERALPPENRLASVGGGARVKSEHELRIERSLQNLTIPDWYKQSAWSKKPKEGFILRRGSEGSAGESRKRWQGFSSSRTPSATSLTATPTSYSQRNIVVPKRVTPTSDWRSLVSSRESLTPASPASLSPREGTFHYTLSTSSLSRWSSSRLSTSSAPLTALSVHRSFRQPYLGWRAAAASSSGGASRSSPGISPVNATTPLQGSRPGSPRRGSQEHTFVYGLQQNQITSAATLRPDGSESADTSRISPLALNTTNVFFNSNVDVEGPDTFDDTTTNRFATPEMRRDRYSYTQSLYSGTVIVSPGTTADDNYNFDHHHQILDEMNGGAPATTARSPQPPPRIWMESSFVGTKKDGSEPVPNTRSIRIVPSDSARADRFGGPASTTASRGGGTCATQTAMGEYVLRDFRRFGITL